MFHSDSVGIGEGVGTGMSKDERTKDGEPFNRAGRSHPLKFSVSLTCPYVFYQGRTFRADKVLSSPAPRRLRFEVGPTWAGA